ncbi:ABC transporter ATP-binding protein/permease [Larsenimonas suaedae]|uniref:ABC transporter ATP-binding protein/permease n=1 Tax=Larsenimonas suaedae TaxID=1851019 RepID=A0ABU1GWS1_9GAMM|nr:ABC transporter ATP-binding protein/permease [Larsenimonas suaedae]MCM2971178.1 ABC transporter ATP-binding protein/permease [Larsenimonas suaedae]MDR5895887.1 ABC transporter ATP-binding protein/permease [Larsenimonas suaedae]
MSRLLNTSRHRHFLAKVWALTKPYWTTSEERWSAWALLITIISMSLLMVYFTVLLNEWNGKFYNALQELDLEAFWSLIGYFSILASIYIFFAVLQYYLTAWLKIRWRRWLTNVYFDRWLDNKTYYLMELRHDESDNPDQRISEDIDRFTDNTLSLSLGLLRSLVSLASFSVILWHLSTAVTFNLGDTEIAIPGFMLWAALLYAVIGSVITHYVGRRLISLNFTQQRYEANFRFSMARLRENSERIALYGGEETEKHFLRQRFTMVWRNFMSIMNTQKYLVGFTSAYSQAAIIFPILIAAPAYFGGAMQLGGLMRVVNAFGRVQDALSWFVDNYAALAAWRSVVDRLTTMNENMAQLTPPNLREKQHFDTTAHAIDLNNVTLGLPDGRSLINIDHLRLDPGQHTLITAPSGTGKSVLFRTLAGIWPWWEGQIERSEQLMFLPQSPYLPIGTLREALIYPERTTDQTDQALKALLKACRLDALAERLDDYDHWAQQLSPGEQQRLAFARALLKAPEWLFLDEATSALDMDTERALYELLAERLPDTTRVSIAHRDSLGAFHEHTLNLSDFKTPSP